MFRWIWSVLAVIALEPTALASEPHSDPHDALDIDFGLVTPRDSGYRSFAWNLGYGTRSQKIFLQGSVRYLLRFEPWFWAGPMIGFGGGELGSPYDPVAPIDTMLSFYGLHFEAFLFPQWSPGRGFPRLSIFAEPAMAVGWIGTPGQQQPYAVPYIAGGIAIGLLPGKYDLRLRAGYSYAPTLLEVEKGRGTFDFGGIFFAAEAWIGR